MTVQARTRKRMTPLLSRSHMSCGICRNSTLTTSLSISGSAVFLQGSIYSRHDFILMCFISQQCVQAIHRPSTSVLSACPSQGLFCGGMPAQQPDCWQIRSSLSGDTKLVLQSVGCNCELALQAEFIIFFSLPRAL